MIIIHPKAGAIVFWTLESTGRSVEFAGKYKVKLRVLSSFTPWDINIDEEAKSGTLITFEEDEQMEQAIVSGIAFNRDEAKNFCTGRA